MVVGVRGDRRKDCVKPLIALIPFHIKFGKKNRLIPKCKMKKATGSETEKLPIGLWVVGCQGLAWLGAPPVVWWGGPRW